METYTNHIKRTGAPHVPRVALGNNSEKSLLREGEFRLSITYSLATAVNPAEDNFYSAMALLFYRVITVSLLK